MPPTLQLPSLFLYLFLEEIKMAEFTQNQINEMVAMYNNGTTIGELSNNFYCGRYTITKLLHSNGVPYRQDRLTKDDEQKILLLYSQYHNQEIVGKMVGCSGVGVGRILRRNHVDEDDIKKAFSKYTLNEKYFDHIDSFDKAYILGLLFADGWINNNNRIVSICLQESDKAILEKINNCLESNRPLKFINCKKKKESYQNQYALYIANLYMVKSLNNLGMVQNKSLILKYPSIEKQFNSAFIRGYIDGDGCIHKTLPKVSLLGTEDFLISVRDIVYEEINVLGNIYKTGWQNDNSVTKSLEFYGLKKIIPLLEWLYKDGDLYIERKKQIYLSKYINNSLLA